MKNAWPLLGSIALGLALTACGGGGGGGSGGAIGVPQTGGGDGGASTPTPSPAVHTGVLLDSAVAGLSYRTETQRGTTDQNGTFTYLSGEQITFSLGATEFPAVMAASTLTPLDLAGTRELTNPLLTNLLVLLQSMDRDGNPGNGITITQAAQQAAATLEPLPIHSDSAGFNAALAQLLAKVEGVNQAPITPAQARTHFAETARTLGVNVAPLSSAGPDQFMRAGGSATLDGGASTDANRDTLTYQWSIQDTPAGGDAHLSSPTVVKPVFNAFKEGDYRLRLVVNDGTFDSEPSYVTVTVLPAAAPARPVASAGLPQGVLTGSVVTVDGSASVSIPSGRPLTYLWSFVAKPVGSNATIMPSGVTQQFVADRPGEYLVNLIVFDESLQSTASYVSITAAVGNAAPVANAGASKSVYPGVNVSLSGAGSFDANLDPLTYAWSITSKPAGSIATLSSANLIATGFTPDVEGDYVLTLTVNDGKTNSAPANVTINASATCHSTAGDQASFTYDWNIGTQKVTLKNTNPCDTLYVWATSAPIYAGMPNGVIDVRQNLVPGATLVMDAVLPGSPSWKPNVIYATANGRNFNFSPSQAGHGTDLTLEIEVMDKATGHSATLSDFAESFSIGGTEDHYGICSTFAWVDRRNGAYSVGAAPASPSAECYVGNIQGYSTGGDATWLPALRYFLTAPRP